MKNKHHLLIKTREQVDLLYRDQNLRNDLLKKVDFVNGLSHRFLELTCPEIKNNPNILELGASSDAHLKFVSKPYSQYTLSDLNIEILLKSKFSGEFSRYQNIEIKQIDATNIENSVHAGVYDRIIACNVLEHLHHPEEVITSWFDSLPRFGVLSILLPCDPGLLWRFGRNLGHRQHIISKGFNYDLIMALEHINPINNLITIIDSLFPDDAKFTYFPFFAKSWNFNLFLSVHIAKK
jgi:phosphatidylethanolamine/phosphatidyl-N-methylethanolamine N-methyltransferase